MSTLRRSVFLRSLWPFVSDLYGKERRELNPLQRYKNLTKIFNLLIRHNFIGLRFSRNQPVFVLRNKMKFEDVTRLYDQTYLLSKRDAKRFWDLNQIVYIFNTGQVSLRRENELKLRNYMIIFLNKIFERWKKQMDDKLRNQDFNSFNSLNYQMNEIQILERRITRFFKRINGSGIRVNKDGQVSIKEPMYVRLYVIDGIPEEFTFREFCGFQRTDYDTFNTEKYRKKFLTKFFPNFIEIS